MQYFNAIRSVLFPFGFCFINFLIQSILRCLTDAYLPILLLLWISLFLVSPLVLLPVFIYASSMLTLLWIPFQIWYPAYHSKYGAQHDIPSWMALKHCLIVFVLTAYMLLYLLHNASCIIVMVQKRREIFAPMQVIEGQILAFCSTQRTHIYENIFACPVFIT